VSGYYTNDAPVGDDQFHPYVVLLGGDRPVDQLKIVAQTDQMRLAAGMLQESVVVPFAVADAVTVGIKGNAGDDDQVGFIGNVVGALKVEIVGHRRSIDKPSLVKGITGLLK